MLSMTPIKAFFGQFGLYIKLFAALVIFLFGYFAGSRMEAGKYAKQMESYAKAQISIARAEIKATFEEGKRYAPFVEFRVQQRVFFEHARAEIVDYYSKPRAAQAGASTQPLITVPSYVSTATGSCGDGVLFSPDELRLYNAGNRQAELGVLHP